jgi:hypothetical protein
VTISDTQITDSGSQGIVINAANTNIAISGVTITDSGGDGIFLSTTNTVALNNSTLAGAFVNDGIRINGAGNTLSGMGNTAAGAMFGGQFCSVTGIQAGSFSFVDDGSGSPATCPP